MSKLLNKPEPVRVVGWAMFGCWLLLHLLMLQHPLAG